MPARITQEAASRVAEVLALVRERIPVTDRERAEVFAREYFRGMDDEDIVTRAPGDLYGAALSLLQFAGRRAPGAARLRVFNPKLDEHGWQSSHTVVEIVNDDMPFLVDSVTMEVARLRLDLHLIVHPILAVERGADGALGTVAPGADAPRGARESLMHVEIDRIADPERMKSLAADLERVLADVRVCVDDWGAMRARIADVVAELDRQAAPRSAAEVAETKAFLAWLADGHFTFLGYRCHDLVAADDGDALAIVEGSALGVLRGEKGGRSQSFSQLPPALRSYARAKDLLILTKSNSRSTVHRPGYMDYIGIKRYDAAGEVCGEHRFLGLYASTAYSANPADIPLLRSKVADVIARTGVLSVSHDAKALTNILDTYPRDELFQVSVERLTEIAQAILRLHGRQRLRMFDRRDPYGRFVTCLIYAPREHYTTALRRKWQAILVAAFNGTGSDFSVLLSEATLARVLITVRTVPGRLPEYDVAAIEADLARAARGWEDDLRDALEETLGEARGSGLAHRYAQAFPAAYREDFTARNAVPDVELVEQALAGDAPAISLYRPLEAAAGTLRFKLAHRGGPVPLSDALPMLERMGLRVIEERPYRVAPEGGERVWLHDYGMTGPMEAAADLDSVRAVFEDAFARVYAGEVDNDDFNRLVLTARLAADEVVVLRAYARYLRQTGFTLSQPFIEATLGNQPAIARLLVSLFRLRFDPAGRDDDAAARQVRAIEAALEHVTNLSEDRVLRQLLALILATVRTNFWRRDAAGRRRAYLSFKFDPAKVPGLPEPKPKFEIFVYAPRFEGVHLRGGKVARGGLRWSDRPEDYRTEVLGLMKAQMVKNIVIVPVGSKGGFVLKRAPNPADRDAYLKEGVACYQDYLRGLLDLTDNLVAGAVVPPPDVHRHDGDDPYLVVAADKGTASFSDYANAIAKEYGFWLDDAFASGGSVGYDHKKMGITARGAWESVKRHFRELGIDTQTTPITVVGVGDMSGDVFGNGMLLSPHVRLLAAFDHRHVFLDPAPDAAASFAERRRLFELPRSSWADYDEKLISAGGGVWPRSAKAIPLSPQVRAALGVDADKLPPNELISAILRAPVDLLYNGGIGTYVKATTETHAEVGDRASDAVRINGRELRCRVVGEGGNLGFTQRGRIEYAQAGGRIYTDAIDNSAGVDTSDHEVNIKILLGLPIADGELTLKQRNELLASMTDDVAALVLRDNYAQTQVLSVGERIAPRLLEPQARFIRFLEKAGRLNRAIEFLPTDEAIAERRAKGGGLTAPERAVLLAYSKIWLYDELLASALPDDPWVGTALARYFPAPLRERYAGYMAKHPLKREIIATHVVNSMVNRVGSTFVHGMMEGTSAPPADVVRAYLLARESFALVPYWRAVEALDNVVADEVQAELVIDAGRLVARGTTWFLRSARLADDMAATIARFAPAVATVAARLPDALAGDARARVDARVAALVAAGVPAALALSAATVEPLAAAPDIAECAGEGRDDVALVAGVHFALGAGLGLDGLKQAVAALPSDGHWQGLARAALHDDVAGLHQALTREVLAAAPAGTVDARVAAWQTRHRTALERAQRLVDELAHAGTLDLARVSVALRELRHLAAAGRGGAS